MIKGKKLVSAILAGLMGATVIGVGTSTVEAERVLGDSSTNLSTTTINGSTVLTGTKEDATKINSITSGVKVTGTGYSVNSRIYASLGFVSDDGFSAIDGKVTAGNGVVDGTLIHTYTETKTQPHYIAIKDANGKYETVGHNLIALDNQLAATTATANSAATQLAGVTQAVEGTKLTLDDKGNLQTTTTTVNTDGSLTTTNDKVESISVTQNVNAGDSVNASKNVNAGGAVNAGSVNSRGNITAKGTVSAKGNITSDNTVKGKDLIADNSITSNGTISAKGNITSDSTIRGKDVIGNNNVTAHNQVVGEQGVIDQTTKDSTAVKAANTVGQNLNALDDRITNVKTYLQDETEKNYVSKGMYNRETGVADGAFVKAGQTVGQNLNAVDKGLNDEIAARIGADAAQDKRINETADNLSTLNQNVADGFNALNQADANEAAAREAGDQKLDDRITNVKTYLQDETEKNYVSKGMYNRETGVADGAFVKAGQTVGQNLNAVDKGLNDEIAARIGADAAQDKRINETADNLSTLNQNVADGFNALNQADANEAAAREAGDNALQNQINNESAARESGDSALQNQIKNESAARQADVSRLDNRIHDVSKEVDTVGALSMAMSGLHPLDYDEGDARFQLSAAVGTYDGTEALALGGFYHFNHDSMISVGVATDLGADEHRMGANIGYTLRIGQGGHVSRPSEGTVSDIMKDIKNLEQKQAKLEQENEQLKQQLAALQK